VRPGRHDPRHPADRGDFVRSTRLKSPRSVVPGGLWRVRASCAPRVVAFRGARRFVASSCVLCASGRRVPWCPAVCGDFVRPTRLKSPRSAAPGGLWRLCASCAPQVATVPAARRIVGDFVCPVRCPVRADSPGSVPPADRGEFVRPVRSNSPRSAAPGGLWRLCASCAPQIATIPAARRIVATRAFCGQRITSIRVSRQIISFLASLDHDDDRYPAARPLARRTGEWGRPGSATIRVAERIVAIWRAPRTRTRHDPGRWADRGDLARPRAPRTRTRHDPRECSAVSGGNVRVARG
jgi:hypothetical protein